MKKIGHVFSEGWGGEVFQDGERIACLFDGSNIYDEENNSPDIMKYYSSLDELKADIPYASVYRALGDNSPPQWVLDRIKHNSLKGKARSEDSQT